MGEAKRKASQLAAWLETLAPDEWQVFAVARAAYERIVKALGATGMCYRMSFFLTTYLAQERGVRVDPVVGYVNDGTGDTMISHAWVELGGKKTDITLTMTEHAEAQPTGALLILGREMRKGRATYTYHRERSADALREITELMRDSRLRHGLLAKEAEHERMIAIAKDLELMRKYLDVAPDGLGYEKLSGMIAGAQF
jgi:hypothetical protein